MWDTASRYTDPAGFDSLARQRVGVTEIEEAAAALREELGTEPVGMARIRHQNPLSRPLGFRPSPKPRCHAASKDMRKRFRQALRAFVDMFREASVTLRLGNAAAANFPRGASGRTLDSSAKVKSSTPWLTPAVRAISHCWPQRQSEPSPGGGLRAETQV